jgi:hypothetical protein
VNLVFVFQRTRGNRGEILWQALHGWPEVRRHPVSPDAVPQHGLFARPEWRGISGCCLCTVENDCLRCLKIWENPWACASIPPRVHETLERGAV